MTPAPPRLRWLPGYVPDTRAALTLVCFPYAGAGAAVFRSWGDLLPPSVRRVAVELPGRGSRLSEPPLPTVEQIAHGAADALAPVCDRPYAMFGHSLGGLVAFEVARRLATRGRPPLHLFVSATRAPHRRPIEPPSHALPLPALCERLRTWGGAPEAILADAGLLKILEPAIRSDLAAADAYSAVAHDLGVPITAFAGMQDSLVPPALIDGWRCYTSRYFSLQAVPGNHFFLNSDRALLLSLIASELERAAGG